MTYEDLAHGFSICARCDRFSPSTHMHGRRQGRVIHWSRTKISRPGAYRFLVLVMAGRVPPGAPVWKRVWRSNTMASVACLKLLRMRVPKGYADRDRTYVRFLLASPASRRDSEARQAWKWASTTTRPSTVSPTAPSAE